MPIFVSARLSLAAHTVAITGGLVLIALGALAGSISLGERSKLLMPWSWAYAVYANWIPYLVGAATGTSRLTPSRSRHDGPRARGRCRRLSTSELVGGRSRRHHMGISQTSERVPMDESVLAGLMNALSCGQRPAPPNSPVVLARGRAQPGASRLGNALTRRRHVRCSSLLPDAPSVAAAAAPRRSRGT